MILLPWQSFPSFMQLHAPHIPSVLIQSSYRLICTLLAFSFYYMPYKAYFQFFFQKNIPHPFQDKKDPAFHRVLLTAFLFFYILRLYLRTGILYCIRPASGGHLSKRQQDQSAELILRQAVLHSQTDLFLFRRGQIVPMGCQKVS